MPDFLKLVVIGSGNLASHMVPALDNIGCHIIQVYSRQIHHANALAHQFDAEGINELSRIKRDADIYLFMVKDDALSEVIRTMPQISDSAITAHSSGASSIDILSGLSRHYGCIYPLQSFKKGQISELGTVPFLVNGNSTEATRQLRVLARKLSKNVSECSDQERLKYHLSAVFMNNFINHLACLSQEYLYKNKLEPSYLDAIARSTFEKITNHKACESQTGPAVREDMRLMKRHRELLESEPYMEELYRILSESIIHMSKKNNHENS